MSADQFYQSLTYLVPTGFAWPRDPNTMLMRTVRGIAGMFAELHDWTLHAAAEWLPHRTSTRMEEWEAATGLPDRCYSTVQTFEQRRGHLLARLRGARGAYVDSSPAAPGAIEALCADAGYPATVRHNTQFRCGRNRVSDRLGPTDARLYVLLHSTAQPFRVSINRVGDRLAVRPDALVQLACALERYVPARFELHVIAD